MREFFQGWRRKSGVVTLAIALVLMAGWLRSGISYDFFDLNIRGMTYRLGSYGGSVRFIEHGSTDSMELVNWNTGKLKELMGYQPGQSHDHWHGIDVDWKWSWNEFHAGAGQYADGRRWRNYILPYWSLVIPLTFLSACLLLWKPRKRATTNA